MIAPFVGPDLSVLRTSLLPLPLGVYEPGDICYPSLRSIQGEGRAAALSAPHASRPPLTPRKGTTILGASTTCSFAATVPLTFSLFPLPSPSGRGLGEGLTLEAFSSYDLTRDDFAR